MPWAEGSISAVAGPGPSSLKARQVRVRLGQPRETGCDRPEAVGRSSSVRSGLDNALVPDVATWGVLVAGSTALGVPLIAAVTEARREERRFRREQVARDFDERRVLLEQVIPAVSELIVACNGLESSYIAASPSERAESDHFTPALAEYHDHRVPVFALNARLVILFGRDAPVAQAVKTCWELADKSLSQIIRLMRSREAADPRDDSPARWAAYDAMLDEAQRAVGSRSALV